MTSIAIIGAGGRMGQAIARYAVQHSKASIGAAIEQSDHATLGRDMGTLSGLDPLGVLISDRLADIAATDAVIDFTFHSAVPDHVRAAQEAGRAFVLGTTGLTEEEATVVREAARTIPVVWAPNMSLGMNLLFAMVKQAAAALSDEYDIEIVEAHHKHKQDAPSGTALGLAKSAAAGRQVALDDVADYGRHGMTGERVPGRIGMHAVRGGDIVGDHTVMFAADGERLELTHRASSRDIFAVGAVKAALWVPSQTPGLYSMQDVLGL
ncbi:MAG: 4-hydroxy-tetrahydrodipicolinate reductase [Lentisphaerae bacterium]|nr:4-hydroxy-tetrahydrodipicolinate reductase [Lentisphaerota bacterium]